MLFHVTHVHTHETCPAHEPEIVKSTFGRMMAEIGDSGVDLIGAWVDITAHTVYMIVDANDASALFKAFDPILTLGTAQISPVIDAATALKERGGE